MMQDNFIIYPETTAYLNSLHTLKNDRLEILEKHALENDCPIIQRDLAVFLNFLVTLRQPKRILELGTNIGFSSTLMALVSKHIIIDTVEFKRENVLLAEKNHKEFNVDNQINVHLSDAVEFVQNLTYKYDFIFIDANKKDNEDYINFVLPHVEQGGLICVDNLLWKGRTTAKSLVTEGSLESTTEIRKFNKWLVNHKELITQILPIGDGISLSIKK